MEFVDAWCLVDIGRPRLFGTLMGGQFGSLFLSMFGKANDTASIKTEYSRDREREGTMVELAQYVVLCLTIDENEQEDTLPYTVYCSHL